MRRLVESALRCAGDLVDGWLPEPNVAELCPSRDRRRSASAPARLGLEPERLRARDTPYHLRLAEELFLLQLGLEQRRRELRARSTQPLVLSADAEKQALAALPFRLTGDQLRVWAEIRADLARPSPMNRLLVGDVGTGKTVLAVLAAAAARAAGRTTALLAPTELLAEQHFATLRKLATPLGLRSAYVSGATPPRGAACSRAPRTATSRSWSAPTRCRVGGAAAAGPGGDRRAAPLRRRAAALATRARAHLLAMSATRSRALALRVRPDHSTLSERPGGAGDLTRVVAPPLATR